MFVYSPCFHISFSVFVILYFTVLQYIRGSAWPFICIRTIKNLLLSCIYSLLQLHLVIVPAVFLCFFIYCMLGVMIRENLYS